MATPRRPSRPSRPARPTSASARRRAPEPDELGEGELEELPPEPTGPSATMLVGVGAGLLFAILLTILVFRKGGCYVEVENISDEALNDVHVKINGVDYPIGFVASHGIEGTQVKRAPGTDVEVTYVIPARGPMTKKLPKKDVEGTSCPSPEFDDFRGTLRIRLAREGIAETIY